MLRDLADRLLLPYADDAANVDDRFTRSRIRRSVMPVLSEALGSATQEGFARSAALMQTDDEMLEALAAGITTRVDGDRVLIPAAPLVTADRAIATRVCRRALRVLLDGQSGGFADVAAILDTAATGATSQLTNGFVSAAEGAFVVVGPPRPGRSSAPPPVPVAVGGRFAWLGATYSVEVHDHIPPAVQGGRFTLLDPTSVDGDAVVRGVEPGDTLEIEVGSTPVSELLRVHGIPPNLRPVSPVVAVGAKIAAVLGVRTAAWAKPRGMGACIVIEREVGT
jgi:tRNA(Ile)-lysidine synthase